MPADRNTVIGLFSMPKILTTDAGRPDLYVNDPGQKLLSEPLDEAESPLDVVANTYGVELAQRLQDWCDAVGLRAPRFQT